MKTRLFILLFSLFALVDNTIAQTTSPYFYGQNHWIEEGDEANRPGYVSQLWGKVKDSGVSLIRIGGNGYEKLPPRERLDKIIDSIRMIGAEPILQVPRRYNAAQTKELVTYYNGAKDGRKIKFWSIGNEPLHKHHGLRIEEVYAYIMEIAPVIRSIDKDVKIFVFDEAGMVPDAYSRICGGDLDLTGKSANGDWIIDGLSFHDYPNGRSFTRDDVVFTGPAKIEKQIQQLVNLIGKANSMHQRKGEDALLWAITEVNVTYANPNREIAGYGNPSFLGGQFIAEIFGLGLKYGAFSVAPWCINETDNVDTDFGYIGAPRDFNPRSSYYHTQLMSKYIKGEFVHSESNQGYVKTIAVCDDNTTTVMILNQDNYRDYAFDLEVGDKQISSKPLKIWVRSNSSFRFSGDIKNQSSMILVFSNNGLLINQISYELSDNLYNLPPQVVNKVQPK